MTVDWEGLKARIKELKILRETYLEADCPPALEAASHSYTNYLCATGSIEVLDAILAQHERDQRVIEAAKNLVKVKGRHHSEIAYQRLAVALAEFDKVTK